LFVDAGKTERFIADLWKNDVKDIKHQTEQGIATGIREFTMTMREGEQEYMPYIGRIHDSKYLLVIPSRPPVCFKCERVGHLRQHCPMYIPVRPQERHYASAVKSTANPVVGKPAPAVGKPGEISIKGTVGKSQSESKAVGEPQDTIGPLASPGIPQAVGKPQDMSGTRRLQA
jgi:hypothetical protein